MSKHRVWSTDDTIERMEASRQNMIAEKDRTLDMFDQIEERFSPAAAGIDEIIAKLRWDAWAAA